MKKINLNGISEILSEKELKNVMGGSSAMSCPATCSGACNKPFAGYKCMRKKGLFLFTLLAIVNILIAQDYNLQLHIEGMQYDSLTLVGGKVEDNGVFTISINGTTFDATNWDFVIPDSIYNSVIYFLLVSKPKNADLNTNYRIYFNTVQNEDTLISGGIFLDREIKKIDMKYLKNETYNDMLFVRFGADRTEENVYTADLHIDQYLIPYFTNTDFVFQFTQPFFGSFYSLEGDSITYDEYFDEYLKMIKKYPDSRFLIANITNNLQRFRTKEDLEKVYNAFSEANRQTSWGKIICNYFKNYYTFSEILLPTWNTGISEPIIPDFTKMNLIIFSASWCAPCHDLIPALKEIYNDLKNRLNIIYISMDEKITANNWRKLMKEQAIPWRSLMAEHDIKTVQVTYNPSGTIPFALLVYPNKDMKIIDIRQNDQREKLYSICNGSSIQ